MGNFDFIAIIAQATLVNKLVLLLLAVMSIYSWSLMIYKYFSLAKARKKALEGLSRFTDARDLREAVQMLRGDAGSPVFHVAQQGVAEFSRSRKAGNSSQILSDNVRRALHQGVAEAMNPLSSSIPSLATMANTAPFIGLFGTVWGIMNSFHQISQMQTAAIATVAPGISEALIATAVGLFVAIPATTGYNIFLGRLGNIEAELISFAGVFLNRVQREVNATVKPEPAAGSLAGEL